MASSPTTRPRRPTRPTTRPDSSPASPQGSGWTDAVAELKVLANGQSLNVLSDPDHAYETFELTALLKGVNINWIWTSDPGASTAALLTNGSPIPTGVGRFREIWSYQRPAGGVPITISVHR